MNETPEAPKPIEPTARICMMLTLASALTPSPVIGAGRTGSIAGVPCQGPACAWFLPMTAPDGTVVGGGCAVAAVPSILSQHADAVTRILTVLGSRAKISPAPGIQV